MKKQIGPLERGDIIRAVFDPIRGHEQAGIRPAMVLSPGWINQHASTILVASLTTKRTDSVSPIEVLIEAPEGGLSRDSKVLLIQTRAIDRSRIISDYGKVSEETLSRVDRALAIVTGLAHP
ncbi:MAG TPA: type II toxin-antitoxin system PemK/MazF family toxin [Candidatus Kapabacteria bacterium]|nr:type II toxin-antitoxin system PemK/MazF family toxin [Candidatus Kapabacteria bacterium]